MRAPSFSLRYHHSSIIIIIIIEGLSLINRYSGITYHSPVPPAHGHRTGTRCTQPVRFVPLEAGPRCKLRVTRVNNLALYVYT